MRNKYFYGGSLFVISIILILFFILGDIRGDKEPMYTEMIENLKIFQDIEDLNFLLPYETEKLKCDLPEHAVAGYSAIVNYEGIDYSVTAYTFDTEEYAWIYFCQGFDFPTDIVAHYHVVVDNVKHYGKVEVTNDCNYFIITSSNTRSLPSFICFMNENLNIKVYQGEH